MIVVFEGHEPKLGRDVFVADSARVIGQVTLGDEANVWFGTVVRGDVGTIAVGARTNIQDNSVVHITGGKFDTRIGNDVTVGHRAILHGCTVEDWVLIGMGAIVMDGAVVGSDSLVGAGALVTPGTRIPPGSLAVGSPARVVRPLEEAEREIIHMSGPHYVELARRHGITTSPGAGA